MGQKVHPIGFRLGVIRDWDTTWFAEREYHTLVAEDVKLRRLIGSRYGLSDVARIEIERSANQVTVTIHTARPGVVIGRGGQRVDELRGILESSTQRRVRLNIQEIRQPELDAYLVARSVADALERRVAFRRAMKQAVQRSMQAGARGVRIRCAGRLGGSEMARREQERQGRVPLHTLRADVDYGQTEARTPLGRIGIKAWIYRGDIVTEHRLDSFMMARPATLEEGAETLGEEAVAIVGAVPVEAAVPVEDAALVEAGELVIAGEESTGEPTDEGASAAPVEAPRAPTRARKPGATTARRKAPPKAEEDAGDDE